jgi:hypothetical protein
MLPEQMARDLICISIDYFTDRLSFFKSNFAPPREFDPVTQKNIGVPDRFVIAGKVRKT